MTLSDEAENDVQLASIGKAVVFAYPRANTPGCTTEACDFRDRYERLQAAGYAVYGISPDKPATNAKFKEKFELPYPLLSDPDHELLEPIGAWGEKKNYGKVYTGVIRSTVVTGEDGVVTHLFNNVKAKGHAARIARELGLDEE